MNRLVTLAALIAAGCGGGQQAGGLSSLRPACPDGQTFRGRCAPYGSGGQLADQADKLLEEGEFERAAVVIERATRAGPHRHSTHVRLYEQLGKAYGFQDKEPEAVAAFTKLLALSPGHLMSYWVSTKATFKFEKARKRAEAKPGTQIDVDWPDELDTRRPIRFEVEVVADPMKLLSRAVLYVSRGSERRAIDLTLLPPGERKQVVVPPLGTEAPETLAVQLVGLDDGGNEVAVWADEPRTLRVGYTPPTPWYREWRYLGPMIAGGLAIVGTSIYFVVRPEPGPPGFAQF